MTNLYKLHEDTVNNLHNMYQEGAITEAQFNEYKQNVDKELQDNLASFSGEQEQMEVSENYQAEVDELVESEVLKTQFGTAILELGAEVGYDSVNELSEDLAEALDNDVDQTNAVLTGDALPNEEFVMALIDLFELDDEDAEDIIASAQEAWQDYEFLMDSQGEEDEMPEEGNYSNQLQYQANFNGQEQSSQRVQELENKISEFESRDALKDLLNDRVQKVENLVRDFHMPPVVAEAIIGNFNTSSNDRIAAFSETAKNNNVTLEAEIHATDKVIDIFEKLQLGDTALFQQYADDEVAEFESSEDQQVDQLAQGSLSAFRKQNAERLQ